MTLTQVYHGGSAQISPINILIKVAPAVQHHRNQNPQPAKYNETAGDPEEEVYKVESSLASPHSHPYSLIVSNHYADHCHSHEFSFKH